MTCYTIFLHLAYAYYLIYWLSTFHSINVGKSFQVQNNKQLLSGISRRFEAYSIDPYRIPAKKVTPTASSGDDSSSSSGGTTAAVATVATGTTPSSSAAGSPASSSAGEADSKISAKWTNEELLLGVQGKRLFFSGFFCYLFLIMFY